MSDLIRSFGLMSLGMATQALITSGLTQLGIVRPIPAQQFMAGAIFLLLGIATLIMSERWR